MSKGAEVSRFLDRLFTDLQQLQPLFHKNIDPIRFPEYRPMTLAWMRLWVSGLFARAASAVGWWSIRKGEADQIADRLKEVMARLDGLASTYELLADDPSRSCLINVLCLRIAGSRWYRMPRNHAGYWQAIREAERASLCRRSTTTLAGSPPLNEYDLSSIGYNVKLEAHLMHVINTFLVEQYRYQEESTLIEVEEGDVVIDGGGCWGDTALYFAQRVGDLGKVLCFEFLPENLVQLRSNVERNPSLCSRIRVISEALWHRTGQELTFEGVGAAASVSRTAGLESTRNRTKVRSRALDDLVEEEQLSQIDFIKLDIEGSELAVLKGAENTLRTFRPKLAVSLYHSLDDFVQIPEFLSGLGIGYEFFLGHFTIHAEETILFARPLELNRTN